MTIGYQLSYPEEEILTFSPEELENLNKDGLYILYIAHQGSSDERITPGLSDSAFLRGKAPMTKEEVRAVSLCKLRLCTDSIVYDIGAGTGSVSIECARQCPMGQVYAIEREEEALGLIRENRERFHAQNLEIVAGTAPEALEALPDPTHVFIGGARGRMRDMMRTLENLKAPVRLCATAVTMESAEEYMKLFQDCRNFTAAQTAVSRIERIGSYHMLRAQNPVFIFTAETGGKT